jgi:6-pyruvoyltetrahydropterin/6-carboxytetrahydropterin synthase
MAQDSRITAVRRIQFAAGHRVYRHESKCAHPHGHNYVVLLHAEADSGLDAIGRVIDFSVLKERIGGWVERWWDHGFLLSAEDDELRTLLEAGPGWKVAILPDNPTAENMARYLLEVVGPAVLPKGVRLVRVVVWETENCYAEASL